MWTELIFFGDVFFRAMRILVVVTEHVHFL